MFFKEKQPEFKAVQFNAQEMTKSMREIIEFVGPCNFKIDGYGYENPVLTISRDVSTSFELKHLDWIVAERMKPYFIMDDKVFQQRFEALPGEK